MPLAAIFLDLGNTLLRERPSRAEIYAAAARSRGVAIDESRMGALMARAHAALPRELDGAFRYSDAWFRAFHARIFAHELGLGGELSALSDELFARFQEARTFVLFPGARELLCTLRERGLVLGLISNWSERLPDLLAALELDTSFDFALSSATERLEKPEPGLFRVALRRAGVAADAALHAGDDAERDARGALAVGLQAVLVDHHGRLGALERALCPTVTSLPELGQLILERVS